ncbi:hypothetical protein HNO86_00530 [Pseudomonas sp. C1C7]|uniref:tail fiber assembly protein n=1 Tax=Pseudomonas sp. C1C7 TaxID=2735272 RepID=UPI001585D82D|nr:tail fiber assembly protein [Pseudomonas sp. C1C7]NUT73517.1 hypothetical protein [Pseudomonas sp. C1C7]
MKTYARIYDGHVVEIFSTDGNIAEMFHSSFVWVDVSEEEISPEYGWVAVENDGGWDFSEYVTPPPTDAQLKAEVLAQRDAYIMAANEATMGMADAYIAGILNEADTARFKLFAAYKLSLSKITQQPGFPATISWPEMPG